MRPALFDTTIYISALRQRNHGIIAVRSLAADAPLWLSSVVLEELYAGAGDHERHLIQRLEKNFTGVKRILVPNLSDWTRTGGVLAGLAAKYGYEQIGQARLTNDALIAVSAGRSGIRIMTANEQDYRRLAEFRAFQWELMKV
jgi:predicted nucleic acid-binding protein